MKTFSEFQEGVASLAVKRGSKVVPALMTGIGAAGMIMQSKKRKISDMSDDEIARKGPGDQLANVPKRKRDIFRKGLKDLIKPRFGETEKFKAGGAGAKGRYYSPETNKNVERTSATGRINVVQQELQKKAASGDKNAKEMLKKFGKRFKENIRRNRNMDEGVTALAVGGSKVVPALMTGIGAVGTIMQARRIKKKRKIGAMEKRLVDREKGDRSNDMIVARRGEADKQNKLIDKYEKKYTSQQQKNTRRNIIRGLKGGNIQDEFSAPTNSVGGGQIAGTVEAGDNPPVKKRKKKTYAYGGIGSRKMWMKNK